MRSVVLLLLLLASPGSVAAAQFDLLPIPSSGGFAVVITGPIVSGDDTTFFNLTLPLENVIVLLDSPGGDVETGLSIGSEIVLRRFDTSVGKTNSCSSICAIIWVSGARRFMTPTSLIGVHAAYTEQVRSEGGSVKLESGMGNADIGAYLNEIGLTREAIRYFTAAPPDEVNPITPNIAQRLDIDVFVEDGTTTSTPADRPTPRQITWQFSKLAGLAANCSELLGVDAPEMKRHAATVLQGGHNLFGGDVFANLMGETTIVMKEQMRQMGTVAWCVDAEQRLRDDGISTGITGPSFDCTKAATPTEQAICSSSDLWALDRAVSNLYFLLRAALGESMSPAFLGAQRQWNGRRDMCAANTHCLYNGYSSRLSDLVQALP
jgi:hypothetical protein